MKVTRYPGSGMGSGIRYGVGYGDEVAKTPYAGITLNQVSPTPNRRLLSVETRPANSLIDHFGHKAQQTR